MIRSWVLVGLLCRCLALRWNQWQEERLQIRAADCFWMLLGQQRKHSFELCFLVLHRKKGRICNNEIFLTPSNVILGLWMDSGLQDTFYAAVTNVWRRALESYHLWAPCLKWLLHFFLTIYIISYYLYTLQYIWYLFNDLKEFLKRTSWLLVTQFFLFRSSAVYETSIICHFWSQLTSC